MPRHIILVGLPGAGKSSVGKLVPAGLNVMLPLMLMRPVATMETPVRLGADWPMVTSPAT